MNTKLLRQRDFSLLLFGKLVSVIGSDMQYFALSLYVLQITGSATKCASVIAIGAIPKLLLGPITGVIADWLDRKKIIVYLDMLSGIIVGIYAIIFYKYGALSLGSIYILTISLSCISILFQPAITTIIPTIVKEEELVEANSFNSIVTNMGQLFAPLISGVLFGIYGLFVILMVDSISFILSSISEMFIRIPRVTKKPDKITAKIFYKDFIDGLVFIKQKEILVTIISLTVLLSFVFNPIFSVGITFVAKQILKVTDIQFGFSATAMGVAMFLGSISCTKLVRRYSYGKLIFASIFICSMALIIMSVMPSKVFMGMFKTNVIPSVGVLVISFVIAANMTIANILTSTIMQTVIPLEIMGRINTVSISLCMALIPVGQMILGIAFDNLPAWICISGSGVFALVAVLFFRKSLLDYDKHNKERKFGYKINTDEDIYELDAEEA